MYKTSLFTLSLLLLAACSSSPDVEIPEEIKQLENLTVIPPGSEPLQTIEFNREVVYGDTEDVIIGRMTGAVADDEGRVFIGDSDQNVVHVFQPGGDYLTRLGREGEGPGEFGSLHFMRIDDRYLYAYDWNKRGPNIFDLESLEFSHSISFMREDRDIEELAGMYPNQFYLRNDGNLMVGFSAPVLPKQMEEEDEEGERTSPFYLANREGRIVSDKFFEQRVVDSIIDRDGNSVMVMTVSYNRRPLLAEGHDDRIYYSWSEDFLIKVYNSDAGYERAIYYPYKKSPLDLDEVISRHDNDRLRRMIRNDDAPATWPALNSLTVDEQNRLWVSTVTDDRETYDWWVINEVGELQARFTWPQERRLSAVKDDHLYVRETNDSGLQQIVRYRMEFSDL